MKQYTKNLLGLSLSLSFYASQALALPIFDRNAPNAEIVTLYPDSVDQNLYYFGPNLIETSLSATTGTPLFLYSEYKERLAKKAIVQSVMKPGLRVDELEAAKKRVLSVNPNAHFSALPYLSSKIEISGQLAPLVESSDCNHIAGNILDDVGCIIKVSAKGRNPILKALRSDSGVIVHFVYGIAGVIEQADGTYINKEVAFAVAGHLGGSIVRGHPHLFLDRKGNEIEFGDDL